MALPKDVKEKLLTADFLNKLEEYRRRYRVKISVSDPRFISFLSGYLNLPEDEVKKYARQLIPLIGDILSRRVKLKSDEPSNVAGEPHIHVNTLANTLYLLLYKLSPATASKTMYSILEEHVVKALSGDGVALRVVDTFFSPVSTNYGTIVEHLKLVLSERRELCSLRPKEFTLLCLKSSYLPVTKSLNSTSPADECTNLVLKAVSEVCHDGK